MAYRWQVLAVTSLASFMAFLDSTIVNIAFPSISASFTGTGIGALSWILSAYNIVFAALLIPGGRVANHFGHRRTFSVGIAIFTVASLLCAVAPSASLLIAARILQAVGAAVLVPTSIALLLAAFPIEERALAVSLWGASAGVAVATGPTLGALLITATDWRLVFLVNIPVGLITAILAVKKLKGSNERTGLPSKIELLAIGLIATALGCLVLGLVQGESWGWQDQKTVGVLILALLLLVAFLTVALGRERRIPEFELFRKRDFANGNLGTLLFANAFFALLLCNVLFLSEIWHYSVMKTGLAMTPAPATAATFTGLAGKFVQRFGYRKVIVPGTLFFAAGALWFVFATGTEPHFVSQWLPGALLIGVGVGLAFAALGSATSSVLETDEFASGSAVNSSIRQIGAVTGVTAVVVITSSYAEVNPIDAFHHGWAFSACSSLLAGVVGLFLSKTTLSRDPLSS